MSGMTYVQPDITLILDIEGVIKDITLSDAMSSEGVEAWRGRPWTETVGDIGSGKVSRMVEDARRNGVSAYSQVTQRFPSGLELPIEYTTVRLGGKDGLIAIGRSLQAVAELQSRLIAAQQAMEQDYWKLREVETRYRQLFDASNDAVLLVRIDNLWILDSNPAAIRLLGLTRGQDLLAEMALQEREPFQGMLARVREQSRAPGILVHLGPDRTPWTVRASMMTSEPGPVFLLQVMPVGTARPLPERGNSLPIADLLEQLPDGFAVIDADGIIRHASKGFLDLAQVGTPGAVIGERLGRWLSQPGADASVLLTTLQRHGVVRRFTTVLHGELGSDVEVEISAAAGTEGKQRLIGVLIRDVGSRLSVTNNVIGLRSTLGSIISQTGKTSLPKLIDDAVAMVERHCIEAALELSVGNRTEAAELLGLSRQSLYKKLGRYGIDGSRRADLE